MPNTKVVANIPIYLHTKYHIFLSSQVFLLFLFSPADLFNWKKELNWKITVGCFLRGRPSLALPSAQSSVRSQPAPYASSGRCQASPSASWTQPVSLPPKRAETVTHLTCYNARYPPKPVPFLCSSQRCPPLKFRPRARANVLHSSLCELPVASLRLSPRLWTASKLHCR
jgi:hypothetical protein